jgi:hypothetical protein
MGAIITTLTNLQAFPNLVGVNTYVNDISSIDYSNLQSLEYIANAGSGTTSINIENCNSLLRVYFSNNSLINVNEILIQLDNNGLLDGQLYLNGGTSVSPSGAGIIAKDNLIAKGWTVLTN